MSKRDGSALTVVGWLVIAILFGGWAAVAYQSIAAPGRSRRLELAKRAYVFYFDETEREQVNEFLNPARGNSVLDDAAFIRDWHDHGGGALLPAADPVVAFGYVPSVEASDGGVEHMVTLLSHQLLARGIKPTCVVVMHQSSDQPIPAEKDARSQGGACEQLP